MLKALAIMLCLVPAQGLQGVQVRQGQDAKAPETPILREWLKEEKFHVAMAPLWHDSMHIHLATLNVLKQNGLDKNIASMSGSSVAGLVAAMWASNPGEKKYATALGSKIKRKDCDPNCDKFQKYQLNVLEAPLASEMFANFAAIPKYEFMAGGMRMWDMTRMTTPTRRESYVAWIRYMYFMDLMGVKRTFEETKIPIAISGFHKNGASSKTVLMSKGNLHLAVLGGLGTPGNTERIAVNDEYSIVDGYMGDEHGARGYDALEPEQRPARMLLLGLSEQPSDWRSKIMDFSHLSAVKHLQQAVSLIMAHRMSQDVMTKMFKGEIITLTGRDLVMATHKAWAKALDSPLEMALPSKSHKVTSYYRTIDWADLLPKAWPCSADKWSGDAKEMQWFEGETNFKDRHLGIEWHPEMYEASKSVEVVDMGHVLEDPTLHRLHKRLKGAMTEMYGGDHFKNYTDTTDSQKLAEINIIDGETFQASANASMTNFQAAVQEQMKAFSESVNPAMYMAQSQMKAFSDTVSPSKISK